ncbi:MAG: hypothetical protein ACREHF_10870 [Rhizomicrobium sp.]
MKGRPGKRRASKGARKSTRKAGRSKSARSKAARSKSARTKRTKRAGTRKTTKAAARKKTARRSAGSSRRKTAAKKSGARKSTARKATRRPGARKEVFGEGNYTASREFRREQTGFVRRNRNRIPKLGENAKQALEGPEGAALEQAEDEARAHSHSPDEDH